MLLNLLLSVLNASSANAFVLEPVYRAADQSGYEVVGEYVFANGSSTARATEVRDNFRELQQICPLPDRTGQPQRDVHFVILAWADREFPTAEKFEAPRAQRELAHHRGHAVEQILRAGIADPSVTFEIVNMASRRPQTIRSGSHAQASPLNQDVKTILAREGAAPSSELETGLFGEYGQRSKAVLWVDCHDSGRMPRRLSKGMDNLQLAQETGRFLRGGEFLNAH